MPRLPVFKVVIHPRAENDLFEIIDNIAMQAPLNAGRFAIRFAERIRSLSKLPRGCSLARENIAASRELRQLIVKNYRVIFTVELDNVQVLRIVHASQTNLRQRQIPNP